MVLPIGQVDNTFNGFTSLAKQAGIAALTKLYSSLEVTAPQKTQHEENSKNYNALKHQRLSTWSVKRYIQLKRFLILQTVIKIKGEGS